MKKQVITLRGPFPCYPTVDSMRALGYISAGAASINVFRVESTKNTLVVLPGKLVSVDQSLALIRDDDYEVNVLMMKEEREAYVNAGTWLNLGGSRNEEDDDD